MNYSEYFRIDDFKYKENGIEKSIRHIIPKPDMLAKYPHALFWVTVMENVSIEVSYTKEMFHVIINSILAVTKKFPDTTKNGEKEFDPSRTYQNYMKYVNQESIKEKYSLMKLNTPKDEQRYKPQIQLLQKSFDEKKPKEEDNKEKEDNKVLLYKSTFSDKLDGILMVLLQEYNFMMSTEFEIWREENLENANNGYKYNDYDFCKNFLDRVFIIPDGEKVTTKTPSFSELIAKIESAFNKKAQQIRAMKNRSKNVPTHKVKLESSEVDKLYNDIMDLCEDTIENKKAKLSAELISDFYENNRNKIRFEDKHTAILLFLVIFKDYSGVRTIIARLADDYYHNSIGLLCERDYEKVCKYFELTVEEKRLFKLSNFRHDCFNFRLIPMQDNFYSNFKELMPDINSLIYKSFLANTDFKSRYNSYKDLIIKWEWYLTFLKVWPEYYNEIKADKTFNRHIILDSDKVEEASDTINSDNFSEQYFEENFSDPILMCFQKLTKREIEVVNCIFIENMTQEKIASKLGISQPAVFNNKKKALEKLRECLTAH